MRFKLSDKNRENLDGITVMIFLFAIAIWTLYGVLWLLIHPPFGTFIGVVILLGILLVTSDKING